MRASAVRSELKERRIDFSDCFDRESLVEKLTLARLGQISAPPTPNTAPPAGAAGGAFEFGAQSRQGEASSDSMEDAFRAAGWTVQAAGDPTKVDTARSPGLKRNFGDVDISDFKKPYSPRGRGR